MATIIPVGEPVNDAERIAIAHLRDYGPSTWTVFHNFEIGQGGERFEVDLAVLMPHGVFLVDVKGTRGLIEVDRSRWYPEGRAPFPSPLAKLRSHARVLKGLLTSNWPGRKDLDDVYVGAAVLLTAADAHIRDLEGRDGPDVVTLKSCVPSLKDVNRVPSRFSRNITPMLAMVRTAIEGKAKKRSGALQFGNWAVSEKLGGTDQYTEYRARNAFAGDRSGSVLLRVYQADPYLPEAEQAAQQARIANAYKALSRLPPHPCIAGAKDFFPNEGKDRFVLVTEDPHGQALRLHLTRPNLALTLDQKLALARDTFSALGHAHAFDVIHRALSPSTILVGKNGRASLTGFEFARAGSDRSFSVVSDIAEEVDAAYLAPECRIQPEAATQASDVYAVGVVLHELFTGEQPAPSVQGEAREQDGPERSDLPQGLAGWLRSLCLQDPSARPSAARALERLEELASAPAPAGDSAPPAPSGTKAERPDLSHLPKGYALTRKYVIEDSLGKPGAFGVTYKVFDTLADVSRALKIILRDRHSTTQRLKREYTALRRLPPHENVVKVIDADYLPGEEGPPFLVFEYVDGLDVGEMIESRLFAPSDGLRLAREVASGLAHLHRQGVYHCDVKPRNLLWTDEGTKLIDFNVSVVAAEELSHGGGSRRYLPPDLDLSGLPTEGELADRDVYALGVTLYEIITGRYPWDAASPPPELSAKDPREFSGLADLAPELADLLLRVTAPRRGDRFRSAEELLEDLKAIAEVRVSQATIPGPTPVAIPSLLGGLPPAPNTNPFVAHLLTLYSQSLRTNAGTRGLDSVAGRTYVETALDRELATAVLAGEFRLVVITGNAGDGKTAFLQKLEGRARDLGASVDDTLPNGCRFTLAGRRYRSNYDGSQDEGDRSNDVVLKEFFRPFRGGDATAWASDEVRLIAINEGRLVDFLDGHKGDYPRLSEIVAQGLATGSPEAGVAVVNLNLRSVVAATEEAGAEGSILDRLLRRLVEPELWAPCQGCDLAEKCYAYHNALTIQDENHGPRVIERLRTLYTLTHLRGRLHITLRDLRSALAFTLVGTRDCAEIHDLYAAGRIIEIASGFYFNSWMGGEEGSADRLLTLLRELDVGGGTDPRVDRRLDYLGLQGPGGAERELMTFERRASYDRAVLGKLFSDLPRGGSGLDAAERAGAHRRFLAMARRRLFFEGRDDDRWRSMIPYRSAWRLLGAVKTPSTADELLPAMIQAINRGEGLLDTGRLGGDLALQVREVERGTVRSYRVFPRERFRLATRDEAVRARFVEHMPAGLILEYSSHGDAAAQLLINLDVFEMLHRLNEGYRPTVEEIQGYYLSLAVFKNVLSSAPYQEVLLTVTGHEFFRVQRETGGRLRMDRLEAGGM